MLAFFLALYNGANWTAQRVQAAMSLVFGSALALAFANALILWLTGDWLGRFMNPAVGIFSFIWILLTFAAFHMNTGLATKTALLANTEIRRFMMGFIIVESATGLFFFMVPLPLWLAPVALVAILMWYLSAKMMRRTFDWNNFRKPAIWACVIILVVGLIMAFGFFDRRDIQNPSRVAPYVKNEIGPYVKGQAKAAAGEIGKIFEKSPPADDKKAKPAAPAEQPRAKTPAAPMARAAKATPAQPYEITVALQQDWSKPVYLPAHVRFEFFGPKAEFRREADGFLGDTYTRYPNDSRFQSGLRFRGPEGQYLKIKVVPG